MRADLLPAGDAAGVREAVVAASLSGMPVAGCMWVGGGR